MQPGPTVNEKTTIRSIVLAMVALVIVAFSGVMHCDFVHLDDTSHVFENPIVRAGLTVDGVTKAFTEPHASLWVPLTTVSFMTDVALFGLNPMAMHIENVILHIGAMVFLFLALNRMTQRRWPSAMVAMLFGLHPVNVESVAWVAERKNVLCGFFFMLALLLWVRWVEKGRKAFWWGALGAFGAALLAKPMAVTFPCVLLLLDGWPLRRFGLVRWPRLVLEKLPFFALSGLISFIATQATKSRNSVLSLETLPLDARITNALCSYAAYLRDLVWPAKLAVFYPHSGVAQWTPAVWIMAGLLAVSGIAIWKWRRHPYLLIGWLMFLGMLVPNLGLVQVGSQARADRFLYFAQVGAFMSVVFLIDSVAPALSRWKMAVSGIVLAVLGVATASQVSKWENSRTLFSHAVTVTENNAMAYEHLAYTYVRSGDTKKAIEYMEASLRIFPENAICWNELGAAHMREGNHKLAARDFRNSLSLRPNEPFTLCNYATALSAAGETSSAEAVFVKMLEGKMGSPQVHYQYGLLLERVGRLKEAAQHLSEASRLAPQSAMVSEALKRVQGAIL